jgi:hypothetical protein
MRINAIFAIRKTVLYSVAYDSFQSEYHRLFKFWISEIENLENFFEENIKDLESGYFGEITIDEAVRKTRENALELRDQFDEIIDDKYLITKKLQRLFRPLNDNQYQFKSLSQEKAKKDWLRIYAIRISENTYVISGGAIKLTHRMEESKHLEIELQKLRITKQFLIDNGLTEESDFGFFEFNTDTE